MEVAELPGLVQATLERHCGIVEVARGQEVEAELGRCTRTARAGSRAPVQPGRLGQRLWSRARSHRPRPGRTRPAAAGRGRRGVVAGGACADERRLEVDAARRPGARSRSRCGRATARAALASSVVAGAIGRGERLAGPLAAALELPRSARAARRRGGTPQTTHRLTEHIASARSTQPNPSARSPRTSQYGASDEAISAGHGAVRRVEGGRERGDQVRVLRVEALETGQLVTDVDGPPFVPGDIGRPRLQPSRRGVVGPGGQPGPGEVTHGVQETETGPRRSCRPRRPRGRQVTVPRAVPRRRRPCSPGRRSRRPLGVARR